MSSQPVVVAWDGSPGSRAALTWAARHAKGSGKRLEIVSVLQQPESTLGIFPTPVLAPYNPEDVALMFTPAIELVEKTESDLDVTTTQITGHPVAALLELSRRADLLVLGTRGHGALYSSILGSTSLAVASHASCPVVVARGECEASDDAPVVVGTDGSQTSAHAVRFAARWAHESGRRLLAVCSAVEPVNLMTTDVAIAIEYAAQLHEAAEAFVQQSLADIVHEFPDGQVEIQVSDLPPVGALSEAGEGAAVLVVGSHGRGGFTGMLLGSVSRGVLFHAPCPVAVVKRRSA